MDATLVKGFKKIDCNLQDLVLLGQAGLLWFQVFGEMQSSGNRWDDPIYQKHRPTTTDGRPIDYYIRIEE